ncbi:WGR domain-containing protein [Rhizobium tubonense]|nr:WGR domain-containing protein [Rhizobium tubonense]
MIAQPYHLYVERIDAARNMARYYALSIRPTLLGDASLLRSWGRIGCRGQQTIHLFQDERQAVSLFLNWPLRNLKRATDPAQTVEIRETWLFLPQQRDDNGRNGCRDSGIEEHAESFYDDNE